MGGVMSREWKPGDVAMLPTGDRAVADADGHLVYGRGDFKNAKPGSLNATRATPLVVIDPDNREQMERLAREVDPCGDESHCSPNQCGSMTCWVSRLQDALRSLIDPPKPPEPMGLGAVVEDGKGATWVKVLGGESGAWCKSGAGYTFAGWGEIDTPRALSDGVEVLADWERDLLRGESDV